LRDDLEGDNLAIRNTAQALDNAVVAALYLAYQGFVNEVADSCKLGLAAFELEQLESLLAQQQRSHAVVASLRELLDAPSWASYLLSSQKNLLQQTAGTAPTKQGQLIALSDVSASFSPKQMLAAMEQFVMSQREFLQEW
jgi:hypothetical protein